MGSYPPTNCTKSQLILPELLRRTLQLVEYYGPMEVDESDLLALRTALLFTLERLEAREDPNNAITPDPAGLRKAPHGETIDTTQLDKNLP